MKELINYSSLPSFGGRSLAENLDQVDAALAELKPLQKIWNRSHSQWSWRHLNLHYTHPLKNLRQISAEISSKEKALSEAKYNFLLQQVEIKKLRHQLKSIKCEFKRQKKEIKLNQTQEQLSFMIDSYQGAMKDVLNLHDLYVQIKDRLGEIDENEIEREEGKAHLQRSLVQCIRDMRQFGAITKGEQEYLEQCGVNPGRLQILLSSYIESEAGAADWSTDGLIDFVRDLSAELVDNGKVSELRMKKQGFLPFHNPQFSVGSKNGQ